MICSPSELGPIISYSIYLRLFCSTYVEGLNLPQYLCSFLLCYLPIQSICHNDLNMTFFDLDVHGDKVVQKDAQAVVSSILIYASSVFKVHHVMVHSLQGAYQIAYNRFYMGFVTFWQKILLTILNQMNTWYQLNASTSTSCLFFYFTI